MVHDCIRCAYCQYREYCVECSVHNTHDCSECTNCQKNWECVACFRYHKRIYVEWSSGNKDIDSLINECSNINKYEYKVFEWIPFERFTNVEYLAKGGFGSIYKASWLDGPLNTSISGGWDHKENKLNDMENAKLC